MHTASSPGSVRVATICLLLQGLLLSYDLSPCNSNLSTNICKKRFTCHLVIYCSLSLVFHWICTRDWSSISMLTCLSVWIYFFVQRHTCRDCRFIFCWLYRWQSNFLPPEKQLICNQSEDKFDWMQDLKRSFEISGEQHTWQVHWEVLSEGWLVMLAKLHLIAITNGAFQRTQTST